MSRRAIQISAALVLFVVSALAILRTYPGTFSVVVAFCALCTAMLVVAWTFRPSVFVMAASSFLGLGFLAKAIMHFGFGVALIEGMGAFAADGQAWDKALLYASVGIAGAAAGNAIAAFFPSIPNTNKPIAVARHPRLILSILLVGIMLVAVSVYAFNYKFNVLRIGYPLGIDLNPYTYLILSFCITWGVAIGVGTLTTWSLDARLLSPGSIFLLTAFIGALAAFTMGSRAQFILYMIAAVFTYALHVGPGFWRPHFGRRTSLMILACAALFVASILAVTIDRNYSFSIAQTSAYQQKILMQHMIAQEKAKSDAVAAVPPASNGPTTPGSGSPTPSLPGKSPAPGPIPQKELPKSPPNLADTDLLNPTFKDKLAVANLLAPRIIGEFQNLFVMRWVGLEGPATVTASEQPTLQLFLSSLIENPAAGLNSIYQNMAGNPYQQVQGGFIFLTLPGPIGVGSYSGSLPLLFVFMMLLIVILHGVEVLASIATRNKGTIAFLGVALAYLTVQMGFPRTLMFFTAEAILAIAFIALLRLALEKMPASKNGEP